MSTAPRRPRPAPTLLALLTTLALLPPAPAQDLPADRAQGAATMQLPQLRSWLYRLASAEFGGRGTGEPGFALAADFVRDHFQGLGLQPLGDDGSYFQTVPWTGVSVYAEASFVCFRGAAGELRLPVARLSGSVTVDVDAKGKVTLLVVPAAAAAGAGGRRQPAPPIAGLDELDLEGQVVVAYLQRATDAAATPWSAFEVQRQLQGKNVAALLFAGTEAVQGGIGGRSGPDRGANPAAAARQRLPTVLRFGGDDLQALLRQAGIDAAALHGQQLAHPLPLQAEVRLVTSQKQLPACNVIAVLPGSDPQLRSQYVVIGSHLDHLGRRGDTWCPGADDDGSGTTGVMAVAQAFAKNPVKPRRSVVFVCFCGEESGLVGSKYFVDHPPIELGQIAAELQMDMIGRDEENESTGDRPEDNRNTVHLIGSRRISDDLHRLCMQKNDAAGFSLEWDEEGVFSRSDHANFAQKGIPIAFFFTGFHPDYHKVSDTPDKIHFEKLADIATWVYDIRFELAMQDARPLVDPELWQQNRGSVRGVEVPVAPQRQPGR